MASIETLTEKLGASLAEVPILDAHTHMDAKHLVARGLDDVMLYHMVISDLYSAGCPDGARLSEWPSEEERTNRIQRALPYMPAIANTSISWGLRTILKDLYGWTKPITAENWRKLDGLIRERSGDPAWAREVLDRARIRRTCTESWRGHDGSADDLFQYQLEWAFPARCQWGEFEAMVYDMEYVWQFDTPQPPLPVTTGGQREPVQRQIRTVADANEALDHYVNALPFDRIITTAQTISTDINYIEVDDQMMQKALDARAQAGPREQDVYASYLLNGFLKRLEGRGIMFQFAFAAEPLPWETGSRVRQDTMSQLAMLIARYPKLQFQCFLASAHANQTFCTLCRELPNLSLAGYWWHNFFPRFIQAVMHERLDMVSVNKLVGFFSDAYTAEWAYAKAVIVRKFMAKVLAEKVAWGQYDEATALWTARETLFETPQRLLKMKPRPVTTSGRTVKA